jgi:hypothetical protein
MAAPTRVPPRPPAYRAAPGCTLCTPADLEEHCERRTFTSASDVGAYRMPA